MVEGPLEELPVAGERFPVSGYPRKRRSYRRLEIMVTVLWVLTPFISTVSVVMVCVAISTNRWLLTQENMENPNYNGTGDNEYLPKSTISGLWTLCYTNPGERSLVCSNIEYFPNEEYSPDPNDSTMAIPYTVTKSATFFFLATFLLVLGEFYCLCGHFSHHRRLSTFISGVIFIISGLLMLIGLVMYISIFKAEIGGKLRPKSQLQPAVFTFQYGFSFILYVAGFISTEVSGTCAVFLYIYWHQKEWQKKRSEVRARFLEENFRPTCKRHPHQSVYISDGLFSSSASHSEDAFMPCLKHNHLCNNFVETSFPWSADTQRNLFPRDATTNTLFTVADTVPPEDDHYFTEFDFNSDSPTAPASSDCGQFDHDVCSILEAFSKTTPV